VSARVGVLRYEPSLQATWDALVAGSRTPHFLFERGYMDYHADRFTDASLIVTYDDAPIAVLPASRHDATLVSHGGLTFGGLLSGPELTTVRATNALAAIVELARGDGVQTLVYKHVPHIYRRAPADEDLFALHGAGARLERRDVSAAIAPGARPAYSAERRRAVRRAAQEAIELGESDRIEDFMALVAGVLAERHDAEPVHTAAEMRRLANQFPGRIRLFTATAAGEVVAGVLVYQTPMVAHAQYIANGARGRELRAGDALFDHLITEVYADRWFDFGISNERSGELNAGLMRNKEGYGARAVVFDRYVVELG